MRTWRWHVVRLELAAALVTVGMMVFLLLSAPILMGGGPQWSELPTTRICVVLAVIGLAWMIRIYRADPEAERTNWRALRDR